ncbi:MAG: hypothetical protein E2P02_00280, partial [Acidobacteria bacterium]
MTVNGFCRGIAAVALLLCLGACGGNEEAVEPSEQSSSAQTDGGARLYVWLYDADGIDPDFLAVIDAEPASDSYGQVLTTVPAGEVRGGAHHTSLEVDRISFDGSFGPHWSSHNLAGTRIVINGYYDNLARRTMMLVFDPLTGQ